MLDRTVLDVGVLDGLPLFSEIAENARAVTRAAVVELTTWSPGDRIVRTQAVASMDGAVCPKATGKNDRLFRRRICTCVQPKSLLEAVYVDGHAVTAPFGMLSTDALSEPDLTTIAKRLHRGHSTAYPLKAQGKVMGAITFNYEDVPTDSALAVYEAFARQAALTLEQAALYRSLQDELGDLTETRRLITASNEAVRREIAERLHGPVQTQLVVADFTLRKASSLVETAPAEAQQAIVDARSLIEGVREKEIRDLSHILHPSVIGLGLAPATFLDRPLPPTDERNAGRAPRPRRRRADCCGRDRRQHAPGSVSSGRRGARERLQAQPR
jgi:GAF domain-containing protein